MSDTTTVRIGLVKPALDGSLDSWGPKQNGNLDVIDRLLGLASQIGAVLEFAGSAAPSGWLICDGRLISRVTYSDLYGVVADSYGAGDGTTTFALPDLRARMIVGVGTGTDAAGGSRTVTLGQMDGTYRGTLTKATLPDYALNVSVGGAHRHNFSQPRARSNVAAATGTAGAAVQVTGTTITDTQSNHSHSVTLPGSGQAFELLRPSFALQRIIFAGKQAFGQSLTGSTRPPKAPKPKSAPLRGAF